jgi:hypothetical protein
MNWIDLTQDRGPVEGSCKRSNEALSITKRSKVLKQLHWWPLENSPAPCSQLEPRNKAGVDILVISETLKYLCSG